MKKLKPKMYEVYLASAIIQDCTDEQFERAMRSRNPLGAAKRAAYNGRCWDSNDRVKINAAPVTSSKKGNK